MILLPTSGNMAISGNNLVSGFLDLLQGRLPAGWTVSTAKPSRRDTGIDAVLKIRRPRTRAASLAIQAKSRVEPKDVDSLATTLQPTSDQPVLVIAPFLSPRTQERLKTNGFAYADLTGNLRLSLSEP